MWYSHDGNIHGQGWGEYYSGTRLVQNSKHEYTKNIVLEYWFSSIRTRMLSTHSSPVHGKCLQYHSLKRGLKITHLKSEPHLFGGNELILANPRTRLREQLLTSQVTGGNRTMVATATIITMAVTDCERISIFPLMWPNKASSVSLSAPDI